MTHIHLNRQNIFKFLQQHIHDFLFQVICHFLIFFLPRKICRLSLFFRLAHWFSKLTLFKLRFLNPYRMYTADTKLSFSKINTEAFIPILQCATHLHKSIFGIRSQIVPLKLSFAL